MSEEWDARDYLKTEPIFVFGSNLAGRHGKGAALYAKRHYGAVTGQGYGHHGNSYAIPTKDDNLKTLPLDVIEAFVVGFRHYAAENPHLRFRLTPIGCGLAGYHPTDIAPMFRGAPENIFIPSEFKEVLDAKPA